MTLIDFLHHLIADEEHVEHVQLEDLLDTLLTLVIDTGNPWIELKSSLPVGTGSYVQYSVETFLIT